MPAESVMEQIAHRRFCTGRLTVVLAGGLWCGPPVLCCSDLFWCIVCLCACHEAQE